MGNISDCVASFRVSSLHAIRMGFPIRHRWGANSSGPMGHYILNCQSRKPQPLLLRDPRGLTQGCRPLLYEGTPAARAEHRAVIFGPPKRYYVGEPDTIIFILGKAGSSLGKGGVLLYRKRACRDTASKSQRPAILSRRTHKGSKLPKFFI